MKKLLVLLTTVNAVLNWELWLRFDSGVWLFEAILWTVLAALWWIRLEVK